MKKNILSVLKYVVCFFALIITYMLLITVVNKIPSSSMEKNIKESASVLIKQGERKKINLGYKEESIFNFTDALMLNMAYSVDSNHPIDSMLLSRKDYIPEVNKKENTDITVNIGTDSRFIDKKTGDVWHTKELYQFLNEKDMEESFEYARYWHGYMIFLRPLLVVFNLTQIRVLLTIVLIGLSTWLLYLIYKKLNLVTAIIFLIGLLSCSIFVVGQSLSEVPAFLVAIITSIVLLLKKDINKNTGIILFISGSLEAFTDLLTEPLIAMLLPITIYFLLIQKDKRLDVKQAILKYIFACLIWIIGYACTWLSKWVIVDLVYSRGMFKQALQQMAVRSSGIKVTYGSVLNRVYLYLSKNSLWILWIFPAIVFCIIGATKYNNNKENTQIQILPFVFNALAPFIWCLVIKNHSFIHPFFSYKLFMISIINTLLILVSYLKIYKCRFLE